jgi:hypothetical protein
MKISVRDKIESLLKKDGVFKKIVVSHVGVTPERTEDTRDGSEYLPYFIANSDVKSYFPSIQNHQGLTIPSILSSEAANSYYSSKSNMMSVYTGSSNIVMDIYKIIIFHRNNIRIIGSIDISNALVNEYINHDIYIEDSTTFDSGNVMNEVVSAYSSQHTNLHESSTVPGVEIPNEHCKYFSIDTEAFNLDIKPIDAILIYAKSNIFSGVGSYSHLQGINAIGAYLPHCNILLTVDITHSSSDRAFATNAWNSIKSALDLKPMSNRVTETKTKKKEKHIPITLGCDPEFEYFNGVTGEISSAGSEDCTLIQKVRRNTKGDFDLYQSQIGIDGAGCQIEIRPNPGNVNVLISNIKSILDQIKDEVILSHGNVYPLGCHVHIGVGCSWMAPSILVHAYDDFIGLPCMKMNGSARGGYASLGQGRNQPHGYEYRSLPSAVMSDMEFFRIVLKLIHGISEQVINGDGFTYGYSDKSLSYNYNGSLYCVPSANSYSQFVSLKEYNYFMEYIKRYCADMDFYRVSKYNKNIINPEEIDVYERNVIAAWVEDAEHKHTGDLKKNKRTNLIKMIASSIELLLSTRAINISINETGEVVVVPMSPETIKDISYKMSEVVTNNGSLNVRSNSTVQYNGVNFRIGSSSNWMYIFNTDMFGDKCVTSILFQDSWTEDIKFKLIKMITKQLSDAKTPLVTGIPIVVYGFGSSPDERRISIWTKNKFLVSKDTNLGSRKGYPWTHVTDSIEAEITSANLNLVHHSISVGVYEDRCINLGLPLFYRTDNSSEENVPRIEHINNIIKMSIDHHLTGISILDTI